MFTGETEAWRSHSRSLRPGHSPGPCGLQGTGRVFFLTLGVWVCKVPTVCQADDLPAAHPGGRLEHL